MASSAGRGSSVGNILDLARAVLKEASAKSSSSFQAVATSSSHALALLQKLTAAIAKATPPPVVPRIPPLQQIVPDQQERLGRILARSGKLTNNRGYNIQEELPPLNEFNATYGTTPATSMQTLLGVLYPLKDKAKGTFVDAGSGQGIPTLAAALSGRFSLTKGIEYQSQWHQSALALKEAHDAEQQQSSFLFDGNKVNMCQLEFFCDDITRPAKGYFDNASCVFLNCVTWDARLCQHVSHRLEEDLASSANKQTRSEDDTFVVSMSRRLALPSFDLVDVLSLEANGGGMFKFYVNRLSGSNEESSFQATSDSKELRILRNDKFGLLDELVDLTLSCDTSEDERIGLLFLATIAASEPTVRQNMSSHHPKLWQILERVTDPKNASLTQKALGSMVLRAMADHPVGRSVIAANFTILDHLLAAIKNEEENPVVRSNFLDIASQLLHHSSLSSICAGLDEAILRMQERSEVEEISPDLEEALEETIVMMKWWDGHQRKMPYNR